MKNITGRKTASAKALTIVGRKLMKDEVWVRPFCPQWEKIILKLHILFDSCRDSWSYVQACSQGPREAARDKQLLTLAKASPHFLLADQNGSKPLSGASF